MSAAAAQLQPVPCELGHLSLINLNNVAPGLAQSSGNSCSFGGFGDVAEPRHDEVRGDREDDIGVVNRPPRLVGGVEDLGAVAHRLTPLVEDRLARSA